MAPPWVGTAPELLYDARRSVEAKMTDKNFDGFAPPPSNLLVQISNDASIDNFKWSIGLVRKTVVDYLAKVGRDFGTMPNVLDLGCGVGRFLFAMKPLLAPGQQLYGCDVDKDCADWAAANIPFARIEHNVVDRKTSYPDNYFHFVYALSVFTHLSLDLQFIWAWEMFRILKPGGVLFFSTHGAGHAIRALSLAGDFFKTKQLKLFDHATTITIFATDGEKKNEGQREMAIIHSLDAPAMLMSALTPVYQDAISTIAAGQTVNMFRKDKAGKIRFPIENPPQSPREASIATPDHHTIRLDSGENGSLSGALMFDSPRYRISNLAIVPMITAASGAAIPSQRQSIPVNAAFGPGHYINWRIEFAKTPEPISVSLRVEDPSGAPVAGCEYFFVRSEPRSSECSAASQAASELTGRPLVS
jgi:SAM-dependent methyltransferase